MFYQTRRLIIFLVSRARIWIDNGKSYSLYDGITFLKSIEYTERLKTSFPKRISMINEWINEKKLNKLALSYKNNSYGNYFKNLIDKY